MFALTTGPLVSILTTTLVEVLSPTPLVAAQVRVVPTVSAVSVVPSQPVDEVIGDSGSATVQLTTTWLVYQPCWPAVPAIGGSSGGGETRRQEKHRDSSTHEGPSLWRVTA